MRLEVGDPRWIGFVDSQPSAHPFHRPEWIDLVADVYGFARHVEVVYEGDSIRAGVPVIEVPRIGPRRGRRWVALPFTDMCPPLGLDERALQALAEQMRSVVADGTATSVEIRGSISE